MLTHGTWVTSDRHLKPHWWHLARQPGQPPASAACEETEQSGTGSERRRCRQESCGAGGDLEGCCVQAEGGFGHVGANWDALFPR